LVEFHPHSIEARAIRVAIGRLTRKSTVLISFRRKNTYFQALVSAYMEEIQHLAHSSSIERVRAQFGFTIDHTVNFSGFDSIMEIIAEKFGAIFKVDWKTILVSAGLCLSNVWYNWDRPATIFLSVSQFLCTLNLGSELVEQVLTYLKDMYSQAKVAVDRIYGSLLTKIPQRLRAQINCPIDVTPLIPIIGSVLATLFSVVALMKMPGGDKFQTCFDRFSKLSGVIRSAADINRLGGEIFSTFWDTTALNIFGVERPKMDEWKNINEWISEVQALITPDFENSMRNNEVLKNKIESLIRRGLNINRFLDAIKVPMTERQSVASSLMFLNKAREVAGNCGAGQTKPRVAPAIIHFFGDSGVGKSSTLWSLIAELQAALGVTEASALHEKTYFRRPGAKFWDGFDTGMNVVVCDDFGAIKDSQATPNEEFLEAIHMSNTAFWQLNMAELSEKRNTFFNAKVVLWTSNKSHFAVTSLTNPEAVLRRVDLKIRQYPHPNFAKQDVQNGKVVEILDTVKVNEAIQRFGKSAMLKCVLFDVIKKDCANDTVLEKGLDFWQIAERCVATMNRTIDHFDDFHAVLEDHINDAISRCAGGEWTRPLSDEFNPDNFVSQPSVKVNAQINIRESISDLLNFGYVHHIPNEDDGEMFPVVMGEISPEDEERLSSLLDTTCMNIKRSELARFKNCFASAFSSWYYLSEEERTEEAFVNLFHQAEKHFEYTLDLWICKCGTPKRERLYNFMKVKSNSVSEWIERNFSMSPTKFLAIAAASTAVFGLVSYALYTKVYKRLTAVQSESYDTQVTKAKSSFQRRVAESVYCNDVTKAGKRRIGQELYNTDVTKGKKNPKVEGQALYDKNAAEVVTSAYRNMYKLEYYEDGQWIHAMNLTVVKGRLAIVNRHLLSYVSKPQWRIRNQSFVDGIEFNLQNCPSYYFPDDHIYGMRDVMMIELPDVVHQHKDITSKFMTADDYSRFKALETMSLIGYIPQEAISMRQYFGSDVMSDDSAFEIVDRDDKTIVSVRTLIKYNIQTTGGDCGALAVCFDRAFDRKIVGIHCAGLSDRRFQGFATPISQKMILEMEKHIDLDHISSKMSPHLECAEHLKLECYESEGSVIWKYIADFVGNFYPIGQPEKPLFQSGESKIMQSPVYGVIQEPTMAPAVLHKKMVNGQIVDPMANARIKASPISKPIDELRLQESVNHFEQKIAVGGSGDKQVLSHEQGITGIPGDPCYPPMKRNTSPGYGWRKAGTGKKSYLGDDDYIVDHPEVIAACDRIVTLCKSGERPSTVWSDTLKDERRTLDKVEKCKTRLFSCGEMAYTIVFRRYFAGFIAHMTRNKIDFESCVGVNVYSMDWTKVASYLKQVGNNMLAGDFTNYDGTLHPSILWRIVDMINRWYDDGAENALIRIALWSELVNSIHIVGGTFYMWNHSQPSGCPMTTILNCTYHSISARYVYLTCAEKYMPSMYSLSHFDRCVRHVNYGDDDVWSIAHEIIDWFNQITISEAYTTLGMTYTDETKSTELVSHRTLESINFLKREFRWDPIQARYRAPLALATIREMAMWVHGTVDVYENCATTLESAVMELAQHSRDVFNRELPAFKKAQTILQERQPVYFKTYDQYQLEEMLKLLE
jgi:hypothetical protein